MDNFSLLLIGPLTSSQKGIQCAEQVYARPLVEPSAK